MGVGDPQQSSREKILAAFGVTEEEIADLEARAGWNAAREEADRERESFASYVQAWGNLLADKLRRSL